MDPRSGGAQVDTIVHFPEPASIHTVVFDFDGVFTDNHVWVDQEGRESVRCDRADGLGLDLVRAFVRRGEFRAELLILSREPNPVVVARAQKLQIPCHHRVGDKLAFLRERLAGRGADGADSFAGLVYLGNDLNDLPVMRRAGFSVAPADAHPAVKAVAHVVLDQCGGEGFVREFIERLFRLDSLTSEELDELISNC